MFPPEEENWLMEEIAFWKSRNTNLKYLATTGIVLRVLSQSKGSITQGY